MVRGAGPGRDGVSRRVPGPALYALSYAARLTTLGVGFLIGVVSARALGTDGRGAYAELLVGVGLVVQLTNAGISTALGYAVARRPRRLSISISAACMSAVSAVVLSAVVVMLVPGAFGRLGGLAIAWTGIQFLQIQQERLLYSVQRFVAANALLLGGRVLAFLIGFATWRVRPMDVETFALGQAAAEGVTALVGFVLLRRMAGPWRWPRRPLVAAGARVALRAFPSLLLPFLLLRSDILLLGVMRGARETGLYAVAVQLVDVLLLLPSSLASMLFPALFSIPDAAAYTARVTLRGVAMLALLAGVLAAVAPFVIPRLFGPAFAPAVRPCLLLLPGAVLLGGQTLLSQFFMRQGVPLFMSGFWAIGLAVNFGLNLFLIPGWGMSGAAVASSVAYTIVAALMAARFLRFWRGEAAKEAGA